MEKNQLIKCQGIIYRVLAVEEDSILLIDCIKKSMSDGYGMLAQYGEDDADCKTELHPEGVCL